MIGSDYLYVADYYKDGHRKITYSRSFERCLSVVLSSDVGFYAAISYGYIESSIFFPLRFVFRRSLF